MSVEAAIQRVAYRDAQEETERQLADAIARARDEYMDRLGVVYDLSTDTFRLVEWRWVTAP